MCFLQEFHNDKDRREFISAGAAAGYECYFIFASFQLYCCHCCSEHCLIFKLWVYVLQIPGCLNHVHCLSTWWTRASSSNYPFLRSSVWYVTFRSLAAAFGAPIGGVLFSMEEASSFWSRKVRNQYNSATMSALPLSVAISSLTIHADQLLMATWAGHVAITSMLNDCHHGFVIAQ